MMKSRSLLFLLTTTILIEGCTSVRMSRADEAYDLMQFPKAERLYERALHKGESRQARMRLADAYRKHNQLNKAREQYRILNSAEALHGDTALIYGEVLMGLGEEKAAADLFLRVIQESPENRRAVDLYESSIGYNSFFSDSGRFIVNRLNLPGVASAFGTIPYKKGFIIAGESDLKDRSANPWNERSYLDLYYCESRTEVTWIDAEKIPGAINGPYHEGPAALSPDGLSLYFTRSNYVNRKLHKNDRNTSHLMLFRATKDSIGEWGDLRAFAFNSDDWSTGHPALSKDGKTLYFASDRPGGFGGSDIWRCTDNGSGWSEPENLGPTVNTNGNELFPTVNESTLHFSSTGHINMGGLDIFETQEQNGHWSEPVNLKAPINTPKDDFFFVLDSTAKAGYLSSDREGVDQIYAFTMYEPLFYMDGVVTDEKELYLPNTEVFLLDLTNGEDQSTITGVDGTFGFNLRANSEYRVLGARENALTSSTSVSTMGLTRNDTIRVEVKMQPLRVGESIAINNIYYDYDKYDIRPDAARELNKLARLFMDNPEMTFELGSHTDSRGGDIYNLVLSDARANSAVDYLIRQGVNPDRITAKGYGEEALVNKCRNGVTCTEEEHQVNRRTEFKVTGMAGMASISSKP